MMAAAAGGDAAVNSENLFGSTGKYSDPSLNTTGVDLGIPLNQTCETAYRIFGYSEYPNSGELFQTDATTDSTGNIYVAAGFGANNPNSTDRGLSVEAYTPNFKEAIWKKTLKHPSSSDSVTIKRIKVSENGNLYVAWKGPMDSGGNAEGIGLARLNPSTGAVIWSKGYQAQYASGNLGDISEDSSGTYVYVAHVAYDSSGANHNMISKLAVSNGSQSWDKKFYRSSNDNEKCNGIQVLGSNIYVVGQSRGNFYDSYIAKFDTNGNLQAFREFSQSLGSNPSEAYDITTDGTSLFVTGGSQSTGYYIAKVDTSLSMTCRHFGHSSQPNFKMKGIHYGSDGKLTVVGNGDAYIQTTSNGRVAFVLCRHDASTLARSTNECVGYTTNNTSDMCHITGSGEKQVIVNGAIWTNSYQYHAVQFDVTETNLLGNNDAMDGLAAPVYNTDTTSFGSSTPTPTVGNGPYTWVNTTFVEDEARPIVTQKTGYIPKVESADGGGMMMWTGYNHSQQRYVYWSKGNSLVNFYYLKANANSSETYDYYSRLKGMGATLADSTIRGHYYTNFGFGFRRYPKFFDVVEYTGTGSTQNIAHSLGSTPGMIWVKRRDGLGDWMVWHRELTQNGRSSLNLNQTNAMYDPGQDYWGGSSLNMNDSTFSIGSSAAVVNQTSSTYVAFLFAHNDGDGVFGPTGNLDVIKCGKYTGNGSSYQGPQIDLGFQPQFLMIKNISIGNHWQFINTTTGFTHLVPYWSGSQPYSFTKLLETSSTTQPYASNNVAGPSPTGEGFTVYETSGKYNANNNEYIYCAVRKPTGLASVNDRNGLATSVYDSSYSRPERVLNTENMDMAIGHVTNSASGHSLALRQLGGNFYSNNTSGADVGGTYSNYFEIPLTSSDIGLSGSYMFNKAINGYPGIYNLFKEKPGFLDVACYKGAGSAQAFKHNLLTTPKMMWVKGISSSQDWGCYFSDLGATKGMSLNNQNAATTSSSYWNNTAPTDTEFTVGTGYAGNGNDYVAILFGETEGVSKIGSYTGNGSSNGPSINCNFNGICPSYIIIKCSSHASTDWYWFSHVTNIGDDQNDGYMTLNSTATLNSSYNIIGPTTTGFQIKTADANFNTSGRTYQFYAIA